MNGTEPGAVPESQAVVTDLRYQPYRGATRRPRQIAGHLVRTRLLAVWGLAAGGRPALMARGLLVTALVPAALQLFTAWTPAVPEEGVIGLGLANLSAMQVPLILLIAFAAADLVCDEVPAGALTLIGTRSLGIAPYARLQALVLTAAGAGPSTVALLVVTARELARGGPAGQLVVALAVSVLAGLALSAVLGLVSLAVAVVSGRRTVAIGQTLVLLTVASAVQSAVLAGEPLLAHDGDALLFGLVSPQGQSQLVAAWLAGVADAGPHGIDLSVAGPVACTVMVVEIGLLLRAVVAAYRRAASR